MSGAAFPLAVGDDREADAAIYHITKINADVLFARRRVVRVGMVRDVGAMHGVNHAGGFEVPAAGGCTGIGLGIDHFRATFPPDVALENVVIVGQTERGTVAHHFAERPAELVELP